MERRYNLETAQEPDIWQEIGKRVRTRKDHRRVSILAMGLVSLRGFLTITMRLRGRTPRAVLAEINQDRVWARKFPEVLTERLRQYWDRLEQELYEHIVPQEVRQKAVESVPCHGQTWESLMRRCIETKGNDAEAMRQARAVVTAEGRQAFQQEYLTQLRAQLTDPHIQAVLDEQIGKREMRGRVKTEGASIKNWPLVRDAIWVIYQLLWPIYTRAAEAQRPSANPAQDEPPPSYPQSLLEDIARLFRTEFPECLSDLVARDVLSRVQYIKETRTNGLQK
jgi:hypothetical protein